MATKTYYRVILVKGTSTELGVADSTFPANSIIHETDTCKIKFGNGSTKYSLLPYAVSGA